MFVFHCLSTWPLTALIKETLLLTSILALHCNYLHCTMLQCIARTPQFFSPHLFDRAQAPQIISARETLIVDVQHHIKKGYETIKWVRISVNGLAEELVGLSVSVACEAKKKGWKQVDPGGHWGPSIENCYRQVCVLLYQIVLKTACQRTVSHIVSLLTGLEVSAMSTSSAFCKFTAGSTTKKLVMNMATNKVVVESTVKFCLNNPENQMSLVICGIMIMRWWLRRLRRLANKFNLWSNFTIFCDAEGLATGVSTSATCIAWGVVEDLSLKILLVNIKSSTKSWNHPTTQ